MDKEWDTMGLCKCKNLECPKRDICYRFKKKDHPNWQSYTIFKCPTEHEWRYFIELKKGDNL